MTGNVSPPSGRQVELRWGAQRAVVVEVGGGLREYVVHDQPVLDGFAVDSMADGGRGQPLLPWPNRLADGRYEFDGEVHQLAIDEIGRHNAIHGMTRWANWNVADQADDRVRLTHTIHPRPGYPFTLHLQLEYVLAEAGLTIRTTAHNLGQRPLPFGAGQHPYFTVGASFVDAWLLQLLAEARLEFDDERRLPTGAIASVAGSAFDFRQARQIGPLVIDECFTELIRDGDGLTRVTLSDPATARSVVVWLDQQYRYVQTFSGDTLAPDRRRRGLAIEPMTCPPDAFRSGTDLIVLRPNESCSLTWGVFLRLTTS